MKHIDEAALTYLIKKIRTALDEKSGVDHTHDRVNGYKIVVSDTAPTVNDTSIITIVTG